MNDFPNNCRATVAIWLKDKPGHQRIGQYFCNQFVKESWPELFYEENGKKALEMIYDWMIRHQYSDTMPPIVQRASN